MPKFHINLDQFPPFIYDSMNPAHAQNKGTFFRRMVRLSPPNHDHDSDLISIKKRGRVDSDASTASDSSNASEKLSSSNGSLSRSNPFSDSRRSRAMKALERDDSSNSLDLDAPRRHKLVPLQF